MVTIIGNMVARNEAYSYLPQVLDRLSKQVDLICFTDDCSDDETVDVALSYGAEVQVMPEPTFHTNEGKLRQSSWDHLERFVENPDDTLVLAIDADEELYEIGPSIRRLAENTQYDVFNIQFFHMWNETQYRIDKAWRPHGSSRLFRYRPGGSFQDKALACGSEPTYVMDMIRAGRYMANTALAMKHLSYIRDEDKRLKYERYAKIDGGKFHAGAHITSILDKDVDLIDWEW